MHVCMHVCFNLYVFNVCYFRLINYMTMMNLLPNNIIMEVNEDIEPSFSTRITTLGSSCSCSYSHCCCIILLSIVG